jgi:hypothetical protein
LGGRVMVGRRKREGKRDERIEFLGAAPIRPGWQTALVV